MTCSMSPVRSQTIGTNAVTEAEAAGDLLLVGGAATISASGRIADSSRAVCPSRVTATIAWALGAVRQRTRRPRSAP